MGRRSNSSDSEYSKRSSRRHSGSRSSSKIRHRDKSPDSKHSRRKQYRRSSSSESSSYRSSSHSKTKSSSSRSRNAVGKSHSESRSSKHYSSSKRRSRSRSRSRSRDRDRRRDDRERDNRSKRDRKRRRSRSRSSSTSSTNSSSSSSSSSSSNSKTSNAKGSKDVVSGPSKLSTSALLARIEEKLDVTTQITRQQAIDDIESEGFAPKSFKSTNKSTRLEDIPMPSLDLKPINLASLKNEVLCHPNLIITQREREEQWVKRLFSLRQRMFGSDMERIHSF